MGVAARHVQQLLPICYYSSFLQVVEWLLSLLYLGSEFEHQAMALTIIQLLILF